MYHEVPLGFLLLLSPLLVTRATQLLKFTGNVTFCLLGCAMKNVILQVKSLVSAKVCESKDIRTRINLLRWLGGSESQVQALRSAKDDTGHRFNGKRAFKAFKRPDTGPARHQLHLDRKYLSLGTRNLLLAYAILRGKAYHTLETSCETYPNVTNIAIVLEKCLPKEFQIGDRYPNLIDLEKKVKAWLSGELVQFVRQQQEAAE